jgi:tetratricopeptide (TPR) repeat protein
VGRAQAATNESERRGAIETFELAVRTGPDEGVVQAGLAGAIFGAARNPENPELLARAEVTARDAVKLAPDRPEGHRILGLILRSERKTEEAAVSLERACALDPTDQIVLTLARTYRRLGDRDTEVETYRAAIQRRPHCWQPYWWLAIQLYNEGHFDAAIGAYENMVQRAPRLYRGYSELGGLLVLRAEYDRAIETLEHAIALRPTDVAFQNLGTAFFNTRRFEEAVAAYNQSFQFGFVDATSWLNLGEAYYWLRGNEPQAADAYKQGIQLGRNEHEERVRKGRPIEPTTLARMASTFQRIGEPDSARKYLDLALANAPENPHVQYHAALVHWQLQDPDAAMAWLEKSVRGGYPAVWLRDSIVFDEWRALPAFRDLVRASSPDSVKTPGTG